MSVKNAGRDAATLPEGISEETAAQGFVGLFSDMEDTEERESGQGEDSPDETTDEDTEETGDETSEESEESKDGEGSEEQDEESKEQPETPPTYRLKIDGEEVEVTLEELQKGYSRHADYTRKTQALSEQRRQMEAEQAAYREQRTQYAQALEYMAGTLAQSGQEPDWEVEQQRDPDGFPAKFAKWQKLKEQRAAVEAERARVQAEEYAEAQDRHRKLVDSERSRLLEAIPSWKDTAVRQREQREIVEFARTLGFSDAEIAAVTDHRAVLMIRHAMQGHKLSQKTPLAKAKVEAIKTAKPGAAKPKSQSKVQEVERAAARLKKSGSLDAAVDYFLRTNAAG